MVFGAMTQTNGFESGFNIKNVRWTGDYWSVSSSTTDVNRITGIFLNPAGSNVYFMNSAPPNISMPTLNILQLAEPFKLSSLIRRVKTSAFGTNQRYFGCGMTPEGTLITVRDNLGNIQFVTSSGGTNYAFPMVPGVINITYTSTGGGPKAGPYYFMAATGNSSVPTLTCNADVKSGSTITSSQTTVYTYLLNMTLSTSFIVPSQGLYNTGVAGIEVDISSSRRKLYTLENVNIVANTMHLACTYFNSTTLSTSTILPNIQRVNLYPLLPTALKPTRAHGLCVDRKNGQYLYICCDIDPSATQAILKFQLRAN